MQQEAEGKAKGKAKGKKEDNRAILACESLSAESDNTDASLPSESDQVVETGREILVEAPSLVVWRQEEWCTGDVRCSEV